MDLDTLKYKLLTTYTKYKQAEQKGEKKEIIQILYKYMYYLNDNNNSKLFLEYLDNIDKKNHTFFYLKDTIFLIKNYYEDLKEYNKIQRLENLCIFDDFFIRAIKRVS